MRARELRDVGRAGAAETAPARTVDLLYFDGCPRYETLLPHLRALLRGAGASDVVRLRRIADDDDAQRERFLGSPSVRVDGHDVEPGADERRDFGLNCRLYATGDRPSPTRGSTSGQRGAPDCTCTAHVPPPRVE